MPECRAKTHASHRTLRQVAEAMPDVVEEVIEGETDRGVVTGLKLTQDHDTVPSDLLEEIASCGLGIERVHNNRYVVVIVR